MSSSPQLPLWVSYVQALAVPLIGLILALLGVWISARQMLTAKEKLSLDEFDRQYERRVTVYEATRKILGAVFHEKMTEADVKAYGLHVLDAQFLFDENLDKYLRELQQHISVLVESKSTLHESISNDDREAFQQIAHMQLEWIIKQGDGKTGFSTRFAPFLIYKQAKRPWLLRWP